MTDNMKQIRGSLFRKKTFAVTNPWEAQTSSITVIDATCLGLATTLGSGVYALISAAAHEYAGPSVVLSILIAAVTAILGGLCYSEVITRFPRGSSAYSFVYATTGEFFAFLIGWGMIMDYTIGTAIAAKACSQYLDVMVNGSLTRLLGQRLGHLEIAGLDDYLDFPSIIIAALICLLVGWSVRIACTLNNVLVVVNLLVISGVVLVGVFNMDSENWIAGPGFFPGGVSGIFSAASLCYFGFVGYDVAALGTTDMPQRASLFSNIISLVFLFGLLGTFTMSAVLTLLIPYTLIDYKGSLLQAFDLRGIVGMRYFAAIGGLSGLVSATVTSIYALTKLLKSLASDGLLFSSVSRYTCPALLSSCIMCCTVSLFCDIRTLIHVVGMGTLASSLAVAVTVLCLRYGIAGSPGDESADGSGDEVAEPEPQDSKRDYGSCRVRSVSVDFVNDSYVTCISELSPHWSSQEPDHRSAATAAGLIASAILIMLLIGVMTLHMPRVASSNKWWSEVVACILFVAVLICATLICKQPSHRHRHHDRVPCVPFLPLCAIWMDVHLIVGLPYTSWLTFFAWIIIGALFYMAYGVWNSVERRLQNEQSVHLLHVEHDKATASGSQRETYAEDA